MPNVFFIYKFLLLEYIIKENTISVFIKTCVTRHFFVIICEY